MHQITIANLTITDAVVQYDPSKGTITLPAPEQVKEAVEPKFEMWKPKLGAEYYSISSDGIVLCQTNENDKYDIAWIEVGNCYPTEEIATTQAEVNKLTALLAQAAVKYGGSLWPTKNGHLHYGPVRQGAGYWFTDANEGYKFQMTFATELDRLQELMISLTDLWKPHLTPAQEGATNAI